jgi:hypothetical protein
MRVSWEHKKLLVGLFLFVYALGGLAARTLTDEAAQETYPFFSWYLFADVPDQSFVYTVTIRSLNGQTYDSPISWAKAPQLFNGWTQSPTHYLHLIQLLGRAVESGDLRALQRERAQFESIFSGVSAVYEVVKVPGNPIERWQTQDARGTVLAEFNAHQL